MPRKKIPPPEAGSLEAWFCERNPDLKPAAYQRIMMHKLEQLAARTSGKRRLMIQCPPGHAKPLSVETPVLMGDGSYKPLAEISRGDRVVGLKGSPVIVREVHDQGTLPLLKITTNSGRSILSAYDHPFLTPIGYVKAIDLRLGDHLGLMADALTLYDPDGRSDDEFSLLGYFMGDGCVTGSVKTDIVNSHITNGNPDIIKHIVSIAEKLGFKAPVRRYNKKTPTVHLGGGARQWVRQAGIAGCSAHTKRVPGWVFHGSKKQIGLFLAAFFDCDGYVTKKGLKRRDCLLAMALCQRPLLEDCQKLLLRLGVSGRVRYHQTVYKGKAWDAWEISISGADNMLRVLKWMPMISHKKDRILEWRPQAKSFHASPCPDEIVTIEDAGEGPCRCLTVSADSAFVANDFIVHNSTYGTLSFVPWYLARNPGHNVLVLSYDDKLARRFGRKIRNICREEAQAERFPDLKPTGDSHASNYFNTLQGNEIFSGGFNSSLAGQRVHCIDIDDPVKSMVEARSEARMEEIFDIYRSVVKARLVPGGIIVAHLTRYGLTDWAGRVLNSEESRWEQLIFPAEDPPDSGKYLWAQYMGADCYEEAKGDPEVWWSVWQQQPKRLRNFVFDQAWLSFYDLEEKAA